MALVALPAASGCDSSPLGRDLRAETPSEKADALLSGLIHTNDPGLAVLVAQDGKTLFEKGYGLADVEHHVPVIPQTTFRIGSITKQFTASAILKLQEEGKLSVNDKLSKYIPDFPRGDEVTLRQLLTHTSGIRDYFYEQRDLDSQLTNAITTETIINEMKKYPYDFDPGTKWHYSNSGYLLLGYIVEKVSGQSYGDFLRENFFQPLGMTNTGVYRAHLGLPHEALGYSLRPSALTWIIWGSGVGLGKNHFKPALNWDMSWAFGCGALYSTVEDLYRWNEGVFNGRVLDAASLKAAFTPVKMMPFWERAAWAILSNDTDMGYGFGCVVCRRHGLREIWHNGGLDGFRSCLLRVPDEKFTVVVLANVAPDRWKADPDRLARKLADIYLGGQGFGRSALPDALDVVPNRKQVSSSRSMGRN
jgi:CubicO group peptidase (beta-lactamase class C family)